MTHQHEAHSGARILGHSSEVSLSLSLACLWHYFFSELFLVSMGEGSLNVDQKPSVFPVLSSRQPGSPWGRLGFYPKELTR